MLSLRQRLSSVLVMALASASVLMSMPGCANKSKTPSYIPFPSLTQVGLRQVWERQIGLAPKEKIQHVWRVGDSIYVTTDAARAMRIEAASGVKAWDVAIGNESSNFRRPVELPNGHDVLLADSGQLFVLNKLTGRVVASRTLNFLVSTDPVIIGNILCLGGTDLFHGIFLDQLGGQSWVTVAQNDSFIATPALVGQSVIIASRNGRLWRVKGADGDWMWKDRKTNGEVMGGLTADQRAVYVPSVDHYLYAFDVTSGAELWNARLEGTPDQQPVVAKNQVFVPSTGKGLYAISATNGQVQWEADGVNQVASVIGDYVWAGDTSGNLKAIRTDNGEVVSSTQIRGAIAFVTSPDQWVIVVNAAGVIDGFTPNP